MPQPVSTTFILTDYFFKTIFLSGFTVNNYPKIFHKGLM